jgi:uncharacterized membrane protein
MEGRSMNLIITVSVVFALLGSALIGGVFFAFSSFIMKALARVPSTQGIAAMQSINVVVLRPSFLGVFIGTAIISLAIVALSVKGWGAPSAPFFLVGALSYLVGTFLVTGLGNVPLNDQLAAVSATGPGTISVWENYLERWTMLNTIRTVSATAATLAFTIGLMQGH